MSKAIEREAEDGTFLEQLDVLHIPDQGFNHTAFRLPRSREERTIASTQALRTATAEARLCLLLVTPRLAW